MKRRAQILAITGVAVVGYIALTSLPAAPTDASPDSDSNTPMCEFCRQDAAANKETTKETTKETGPAESSGDCSGGQCAGGQCSGGKCSGGGEGGKCHGKSGLSDAAAEDGTMAQGRGPGPGAGRGRGRGRQAGRGPDADFERDHNVFHYLLEHHTQVRRTVKRLDDGVETLTESDDPDVAKAIQEHVHAMYRRVDENRPIRRRDPLFNAIFSHASKVKMQVEETEKGVRVVETSDDPFVARLIQAHADVVSAFVKHGHAEAMKNHPVPVAE